MDFAPTYLLYRFFYRFFQFFHNWYVHGSRNAAHWFLTFLERLDRVFAVKITLLYFFHPLYGDYSIIGRILGVIFRSFRIAIGVFVYFVIAAIAALCYVFWLSIPIILLVYASRNI